MERPSDYATAATISPFFEFLSLLVLGFTWIYFNEWTDVPGSMFSALLLAQVVSLIVGVSHWFALWRDHPRVASITLMHGVTELVTLLAGVAALSLFVYVCVTNLPAAEMDQRVMEGLIASAVFSIVGSSFGLVVYWGVGSISRNRFGRSVEN